MSSIKNLAAAYQSATHQRLRILLLILPVAISTALAVTTLGLDKGVTRTAQEAAVSFGLDQTTVHGAAQVIAGKFSTASSLRDADIGLLRDSLTGLKGISGTRRENEVPISFGSKSGIYKVFGVSPEWAQIRNFGAERGQFVEDTDLDASAAVCVVGQTVARELFGEQDPIGQQILVNQVPFRVKGVLVARGSSPAEGDRDARIIIPLTTFYDRLYQRLHLDQIVMQVSDASTENLARLENDIKTLLRKQHRIEPGQPDDFTVRTPITITAESRLISENVFRLLFGLALVSTLLSAFIIGAVFHQAVTARQNEIGLRRAIGASPGDILQQLWAEGLLVSLLGVLLGFSLGLTTLWQLARWKQLPYMIDSTILIAAVVILTLSSLGPFLAGRTAARITPNEALRPVS